MPDSDFVPCDPKTCPAVTGKPFGSVRYCPKKETARHRDVPPEVGVIKIKGWKAERFDWRSKKWVTFSSIEAAQKGIPPHPNETDCCVDFGCCF